MNCRTPSLFINRGLIWGSHVPLLNMEPSDPLPSSGLKRKWAGASRSCGKPTKKRSPNWEPVLTWLSNPCQRLFSGLLHLGGSPDLGSREKLGTKLVGSKWPSTIRAGVKAYAGNRWEMAFVQTRRVHGVHVCLPRPTFHSLAGVLRSLLASLHFASIKELRFDLPPKPWTK